MHVSVIIPVFNDPDRLGKAIASLLEQDYPKERMEIIIADNGSADNTLSIARSFSTNGPEVIKTVVEKNVQSSYAARNLALAHAGGDVIAFTDSDCIAHPQWVSNGVRKLSAIPNCGIVGGNIQFLFHNPGKPNIFEVLDCHTSFLQKENIEKARFSVTANMFTHRRVFDTVGMFNADLQSGGDLEWGNRVAANGYRLAYCEDAVIYHPARHRLAQHLKKGERVSSGRFELFYRPYPASVQIRQLLLNDALPPVRRIRSILTGDTVTGGMGLKVRLALLVFLFKYLNLYWRLKQMAR